MVSGGFVELEVFAKLGDVEDAAVVHAEVEEGLLEFADVSYAEVGGHIAFKDFVDDAFADKLLSEGDIVDLNGFRKATSD